MPEKTNEHALEASIEKVLTGSNLEELKTAGISTADFETNNGEHGPIYWSGKSFYIGDTNTFYAKYAIDGKPFCHFLESTQKDELEKLEEYKATLIDNAVTVKIKVS